MSNGQPNIVVVLMDTARADRFSTYGNERATTPFLDEFHDTRYEEAYSTSIWSLPAYVSLFTGELPSEHGILSWKPGAENTLVPQLEGYRTLCISPHVMGGGWGLADAFDHHEKLAVPHRRPLIQPDPVIDDMQGKGLDVEEFLRALWKHKSPQTLINAPYQLFRKQILYRLGYWEDSGAADVVDRSKEVVSKTDKPFFLFMNFVESHKPMYLPREWMFRWADESPEIINEAINADLFDISLGKDSFPPRHDEVFVDVHDSSLSYQDSKIEEFHTHLQSEGKAEDTVFIVLSDHGNLFGERGIWGHHLHVDRGVSRIPLLVSYPWESPDAVNEPVSITDIYDAILRIAVGEETTITSNGDVFVEYAGYDEETLAANDVSTDPWSYYQVACVSGRWKLNWRADDKTELYRLPGEEDDISEENPAKTEELKSSIRERLGTPDELHKRHGTGTDIEQLSDETIEHLKSMGYLKGETA